MKKMRRMIALLVAMVMVIGTMSMAAYAAPKDPTDPYDDPLTITGLDEGDIVGFYKIVEWVGTDDNDANAADNVAGWKSFDPYATILTKAKLSEVLVGDKTANPPVPATGITAELAGELARIATTKADYEITAGADGKVVYETPAPGLYMAIIKPIDVDTLYNPVFLGSDFIIKTQPSDATVDIVLDAATYADTAAAKKTHTSVDKTAETKEDPWDDMEWVTTAIGDTVDFTVTTVIPAFGEVYLNPKFDINDHLTWLTLVKGSVKVTKPANAKYTVSENSALDGYTITFDPTYLKTIATATDVEVTYSAIVSPDAPLNVNYQLNEVSTIYTHDPTNETDYKFKKDETNHYTFTLDASGLLNAKGHREGKTSELVKIAVDGAGNPINAKIEKSFWDEDVTWEGPMKGAKFALYTDDKRTPYHPKDKDGNYIDDDGDGNPDDCVVTSEEDGRFQIEYLDAGTYYIEEIEAPAGFIKDNGLHKVEIEATYSEKDVTEYTKTGKANEWISQEEYDDLDDVAGYKSCTFKTQTLDGYTVTIDGETAASYKFVNNGPELYIVDEEVIETPFEFINIEGVELPSTGGIGTTLFYVVGSVLVIGAAVLLISKRRMVR